MKVNIAMDTTREEIINLTPQNKQDFDFNRLQKAFIYLGFQITSNVKLIKL